MKLCEGHLENLQKIVRALGGAQYDQAATLAHEELGFPMHHQVMLRDSDPFSQLRYSTDSIP